MSRAERDAAWHLARATALSALRDDRQAVRDAKAAVAKAGPDAALHQRALLQLGQGLTRLQEHTEAFFARAGLPLIKPRGARDYRGAIADISGVEVAYLSAGEIASALAQGMNAETAATAVSLQAAQQAWQMMTTEQQMQLNGKPYGADIIVPGVAIVDVKTTADASPEGFGRLAYNLGYHMQADWYITGWETVTGERLPFVWLTVEADPPHLVAVYYATDDQIAAGHALNADARALFAACESSGEWPGYPPEIAPLTMPAWARL